MRNIEILANQVSLYKSKSGQEIDKKISALELQSKNYANRLKNDNENLKAMISFKDDKVLSLQTEINRLRTVLKIQAKNFTRNTEESKENSNLEGIVDEIAKNGKLEYKVTVKSDKEKIDKECLSKIFMMTHTDLAKTVISQGKLLEEYAKKSNDEISNLKQMIDKLCKFW